MASISTSTSSSNHQAAISSEKGSRLVVVSRPTPEPGPNEVLIEVKAVALNPVDHYQRDHGFPPIATYPTVLGSDVAGVIAKTGSNINSSDTLTPGTRVVAFATGFSHNNDPAYGAFQKYVLASSSVVAPLPDHITFEAGALLPMATYTTSSGWWTIGIPYDTKYSPENKQAVLVWGGSSSVGSMAVQSAKLMGFTVYTTASAKHHDYVKSLGADRVFDYKLEDVTTQIVQAAKEDQVTLRTAYCAVSGSLQPTIDILTELNSDGRAKIAHAPILPSDITIPEGMVVKFVSPPQDPAARSEHLFKAFRVWLADHLASGEVVPSPHIRVMEGRLDGLNDALDVLKEGVSGTKLVLNI